MMSVRKHRWAAGSILLAGVVVLVAWGRSQANETAEIRAVRDQFQGKWVATLVQAGLSRKVEGAEAARCQIEFTGKSLRFQGMIGGSNTRGTYFIDPRGDHGKLDLKLDAGWSVGLFEVSNDRLAMAINILALPERLGVPTRGRPIQVQPGDDHHYYVFRRAIAGE